jgi:Ca-activated chloride channel homolog
MENEELKRILNQLPIPEHGLERKDKAMESAMAEFRHHAQNKRKFKGFSLLGRLMDKKHTGGFLMPRQIAIGTGIAVGVIAFASVFSVYMVSNMKPPFVHEKTMVATVKNDQVNPPASADTVTSVTAGQEQVQTTTAAATDDKTPINRQDFKFKASALQNQERVITAKVETSNKKIADKPINMPGSQGQTLSQAPAAAKYVAPKITQEEMKPSEELPTINQASSVASDGMAAAPPTTVSEFTLEEITVLPAERSAPISPGISNAGFRFPLNKMAMANQEYVGRDKFEKVTPNSVTLVSEEPVSTFSIDVDTASYPFVRRALNNGYLPQKDSVRVEEMINYFNYKYPLPKDRNAPFMPTVAVFPTPWNSNTKLLHIGIKGFDIVPEKKPKANLVFLIDVSGSMESDDKLPLLKNSLRMFVDTLKPDDTVAIVTYAGSTAVALERTRGMDKAKILAAIDQLHAGGSTSGAEGIRTAYSLAESNFDSQGVNRIILATDGDFNVGITDPEALKDFVERKRKSGIYLSVLGFGQGNYNDTLMQKLAQNGNGNAAYIDNLNEARKVLVDEASSTLFTIAKDVKIQVEFNPAMVSEYRLIGYETRLLNREDFKNDNVDAGDIGSGHSVTAIYEITPKGSSGQLIDDLRYDSKKTSEGVKASGSNSEYAFLKIRYKLPSETTSREISAAINKGNEYKNISEAPGDSRFASAVAAFGQLVKGDSHINQFTYDDVINLGRSSIGDDLYGYRAEFLNLARLAKTAAAGGDR